MSTKSTPRKKTTGTTNTKSPRPRTKAAAGGKATSKKKAASATAGAETDSKPSSAEADSEPAVLTNTAAPSAEDENPDEPPNRPNPLTAEQKNLDLLTQIDLALGIKETALLGKKGLVASHNFRISREGCQQLLDWLEHRLDASIAAMKDPREEAMEVEIGNLSTRFRQPPEEQSGGAVPIYGSDMYTLMFYRRGGLWFVAAFNYELNTPYLDFGKWQQDLLAMLSEAGL